jgi:RIO kinase 2
VENLGETYLKLTRDDFSTLRAVDVAMRTHQWVPLEEISRNSGLSPEKADYRLRQLSDLGLICSESKHYLGFRIDFDAYDILALADLVNKNAVKSIGERIGVGKESVVYEAMGEIPLAIKFHREGRTSFRHVRRVREHLKDEPRCSWLNASRLGARYEFKVMTALYPKVSIPQPVALSRHAIAMEFISGAQLLRVQLNNPSECLDIILEQVSSAYSLGFIHADLSEYNIIISQEEVKIIDWPQAIRTDHPNAPELLERDLSNVLKFFSRRYGIETSIESALEKIKGPLVQAQEA